MSFQSFLASIFLFCITFSSFSQDYYFKDFQPFDSSIPSPEAFLGYPIGEQHTRHDQIVAYFSKLAELSDKAKLITYGKTHENRSLIMLAISSTKAISTIDEIQRRHLESIDATRSNAEDLPLIVQLGYSVHGNEPSSAEAALLMAYTLIASKHPDIESYRNNAIVFIDPVINPDGRDRHTQWANQYKSKNLVADPNDAEHNENWPRGRTNHYWFDLNRDWLLAINPESRGKLDWFHQWYPNVVTDFHEMGTQSTYFFEPMKANASANPLMPKENYEDLNSLFATYYAEALNNIGSFYYTKESFDGTYPGYGSSYPDLQGSLAILFEQASSRGHIQKTDYGTITFPFTIKNQYTSSVATLKAATENKSTLRNYQKRFFESALNQKPETNFAAYEFGDETDVNRTNAFIDKLLIHKIKVYKSGNRYTTPLQQKQRRMVQTMFETYKSYSDSVFYDASAWSLANFYNMPYKGLRSFNPGEEVTETTKLNNLAAVTQSNYAYVLDWDDYNTPAALHELQNNTIIAASAFKPFSITTAGGNKSFNYGSILIPVTQQKLEPNAVFKLVQSVQQKYNVPIYAVNTSFSNTGIDLGSNNFKVLKQPKVALMIGDGVNSYEAGEVWHLLDTRMHIPLTKLLVNTFDANKLSDYNTIVMVSGRYNQLDSIAKQKLKQWVASGNTLVTIAGASKWAIDNKLIAEKLTTTPKDTSVTTVERLPFVEASEHIGREQIGGVILNVNLDITHPLGFGYKQSTLPVYKNNTVFIQPSKNPYATVSKYSDSPHVDGYISEKNLDIFLKSSASLVVSQIGAGRVVVFADNPNFRGSWYGTNKLFLNALFFGRHINVPKTDD